MEVINNNVILCGTVCDGPRFSHVGGNESYYTFPLEIERLSGAADRINIVAKQSQIEALGIEDAPRLMIIGQLRSFNNKQSKGSKLVITVLAGEMFFTYDEYQNQVSLTGAVCKPTTLRKTPMGRQICDIMLAVNRSYGRSDYLPCIAWGQLAEAASTFAVGDRVTLRGRIQSRKYLKAEGDIMAERTAYEVSVVTFAGDEPGAEDEGTA